MKLISVDDLSNQRNQVFKDHEEFIESSVKETIEKWNLILQDAFIKNYRQVAEVNYFAHGERPEIVNSLIIKRLKEQLTTARYSFTELSEGSFRVQNPFIETNYKTVTNTRNFAPPGCFGNIPNYGGNGIYPFTT